MQVDWWIDGLILALQMTPQESGRSHMMDAPETKQNGKLAQRGEIERVE